MRTRANKAPFARDALHYPFERELMRDSIPDMTDDAEEVEGSTTVGHRTRRRYFAAGTGTDIGAGDSGSITIRAVNRRDARAYQAQRAPRPVPGPHRAQLAPTVAALPVPSIRQPHHAIGPWFQPQHAAPAPAPHYWPDASSQWRKERARRLAPYERTQLVRAEIPSLVRPAYEPFNYRLFTMYLLSTIIIAAICAITICLV